MRGEGGEVFLEAGGRVEDGAGDACRLCGAAGTRADRAANKTRPRRQRPPESSLHFLIIASSIAILTTVGIVLSMVFGHALIILPAIARIRLRYAPALYVPLLLLHGSVILRVGGGLAGWDAGRKGSGVLTVVALAAFAVSLALARRRPPVQPAGHVLAGLDRVQRGKVLGHRAPEPQALGLDQRITRAS